MIYKLDEQYYVRTLHPNDILGPYPNWFQDQITTQFNSHGKFTKTIDFFENYINQVNNENQLVWAICHHDDGHIGNISLQLINFLNRNADFSILIGEKNHWGKGLAFKASKIMLQHGFYKLNLKRIYCSTSDSNISMKKLALKLGMSEEGRCRSHIYLNGNWVDMIRYGILRDECSKSI
jgi:RimJ/RimL family protein N-acetyltransferase